MSYIKIAVSDFFNYQLIILIDEQGGLGLEQTLAPQRPSNFATADEKSFI
jgi:hypothetical protein